MEIALTARTDLSFADAVSRVRETLAEQGFGVLTEIDVQATMKAKLDVDVAPYLILGACNPPLAHQALAAAPEIGLLLPCNVTVRTDAGGTVVQAMDPQLMVDVVDRPELQAVASQAAARLRAALAALPPAS
ncbi:MAG: hypothetical protein JWN57_2354 [Frankiales bacterium]|jgi:uncharacterized protein (DUF302 family)|nr:hypothetical protein [Frankiales bacterium]